MHLPSFNDKLSLAILSQCQSGCPPVLQGWYASFLNQFENGPLILPTESKHIDRMTRQHVPTWGLAALKSIYSMPSSFESHQSLDRDHHRLKQIHQIGIPKPSLSHHNNRIQS
jgi:hypothetical protein